MAARDAIIEALEKKEIIESAIAFAKEHGLAYDNAFIGAIKSLEAAKIIVSEMKKITEKIVTQNAKDVIENGSEEFRLFNMVKKEGTPKAELEVCVNAVHSLS